MEFETTQDFYEKDFAEFSSITEYLKSLKSLAAIDFSNKSKNEIREIIYRYLHLVPALLGKYEPEKFNKFKLYRVRLNVNEEKENLKLIRTYSYPIPFFCKINGRANLANAPVFYASNSALTSIMESKPKEGEIGYLSLWNGQTDRTMISAVLMYETLKKITIGI